VSVAIDDFGTGYSALSYLSKLPFNALKIDRIFMKEIMRSSETRAMVRSLIVIAQELGMNVIVEGIENEAQLKAIQEIGANQVQGYYLGRPTPDPLALIADMDAMIAKDVLDQLPPVPDKLEVR
jgi:EAL domain-containing protein (putative c-di-GMP-specific phosphodiesterase class I)